MKRTNHYIPRPQLLELKRLAKRLGVSVSELIRTAISDWLGRQPK